MDLKAFWLMHFGTLLAVIGLHIRVTILERRSK